MQYSRILNFNLLLVLDILKWCLTSCHLFFKLHQSDINYKVTITRVMTCDISTIMQFVQTRAITCVIWTMIHAKRTLFSKGSSFNNCSNCSTFCFTFFTAENAMIYSHYIVQEYLSVMNLNQLSNRHVRTERSISANQRESETDSGV